MRPSFAPRTSASERLVAVSDVGQADPSQASEDFSHGEEIGQRLAGVQVVRKTVDDGTVAWRARSTIAWCEKVRAMMPSAMPDRVRAMSATLSRFPIETSDGPREMACPPSCVIRLEADARAQRRLLEDHRQRPSAAAPPGRSRGLLHLRGEVQNLQDLLARQIVDRDQVRAFHLIPALPLTRGAPSPRRGALVASRRPRPAGTIRVPALPRTASRSRALEVISTSHRRLDELDGGADLRPMLPRELAFRLVAPAPRRFFSTTGREC